MTKMLFIKKFTEFVFIIYLVSKKYIHFISPKNAKILWNFLINSVNMGTLKFLIKMSVVVEDVETIKLWEVYTTSGSIHTLEIVLNNPCNERVQRIQYGQIWPSHIQQLDASLFAHRGQKVSSSKDFRYHLYYNKSMTHTIISPA